MALQSIYKPSMYRKAAPARTQSRTASRFEFNLPAGGPSLPSLSNIKTLSLADFGGPKPDPKSIIKYLMPGVKPEADAYLNEFGPARLAALRRAIMLGNPANVQGRLDAFRRRSMHEAQGAADQGIRSLTPGYDPRTLDAIRLGAINNAQRSGNAYQAKELSTEEQQKAFITQLQLLDPEMSMPTINAIMKWLAQQPPEQQKSSGMDGIASIVGAVAGFL